MPCTTFEVGWSFKITNGIKQLAKMSEDQCLWEISSSDYSPRWSAMISHFPFFSLSLRRWLATILSSTSRGPSAIPGSPLLNLIIMQCYPQTMTSMVSTSRYIERACGLTANRCVLPWYICTEADGFTSIAVGGCIFYSLACVALVFDVIRVVSKKMCVRFLRTWGPWCGSADRFHLCTVKSRT